MFSFVTTNPKKLSAPTGTRVTRSASPSKSILMYSFFFSNRHFIAFRWKRILYVFPQSERVNLLSAIRRKIEFNLADVWRELPRPDVVQIISFRVPGDV